MTILVVVSHPDDEVLGVGGAGAVLAEQGISVRACILSGNVMARTLRPDDHELRENIHNAREAVGFGEPILGDFPNIRFNTVDHISLVQFIESAIVETQAHTIFTHHPSDLNNDHRQTSLACQAAARLFQRRNDVPRLRALFYMEILSATDWAFPGQNLFIPDTFFEIGKEALGKKIDAVSAYCNVMRDFPHPRSNTILTSLAAYRGGQSGTFYAEAFQTAFRCASFSEFLG